MTVDHAHGENLDFSSIREGVHHGKRARIVDVTADIRVENNAWLA